MLGEWGLVIILTTLAGTTFSRVWAEILPTLPARDPWFLARWLFLSRPFADESFDSEKTVV